MNIDPKQTVRLKHEPQRFVIKHTQNRQQNALPENVREELTDELCAKIARFNGCMTAGEVHASLMRGASVYTNFSRWVLE